MKTLRVTIKGQVQGLGFRPYVYRLATQLGVTGHVANTSRGVQILAQGPNATELVRRLKARPPPLARITTFKVLNTQAPHCQSFTIRASRARGKAAVDVLPDIATCPQCRAEVLDPGDRRHGYAFTNCTQCGPRYTIIEGLPYDRPATTMRLFPMCPDCAREYRDPTDRRFHAQPNACPVCGPELRLLHRSGREIKTDPLGAAARAIASGRIVAVRSLGGFQLACDATNDRAVRLLRRRKRRPAKPLALMCREAKVAAGFARLGRAGRAVLTSPSAPIVLLEKHPSPSIRLSPAVAPRNGRVGVMLAYTPLHFLLLDAVESAADRPAALVMTSANRKEEPLAATDEELLAEVAGVADIVLTHNRQIANRIDDSVVLGGAAPILVRRARGFAPQPVQLDPTFHVKHGVLGVGGEMKNSFVLVEGGKAYLSPHIGDVSTLRGRAFFRETLRRLMTWTGIEPQLVACDLHPDYASVRLAEAVARELRAPLRRVQHHYAHVVSVMAERGLAGPVLGLSFDGTGYGTDGGIWGCEFILVEGDLSWRRVGHLAYLESTEGGDLLADPGRVAAAYLLQAKGQVPGRLGLGRHVRPVRAVLESARGVRTSSLGRLFDCVAGITGICPTASFEGEAAIALESAAADSERGYYDVGFQRNDAGMVAIDSRDLVRQAADDVLAGTGPDVVSARFHNSLVRVLSAVVSLLSSELDFRAVALTGGALQNSRLRRGLLSSLSRQGLRVQHNQLLPVNDGGIALGQAVAGSRHRSAG